MNIVFCVDRRVLPGLHVAAYSLLERINSADGKTSFFVFSDELDGNDMELLHQTLASLNKPFALELRRVDPAVFTGFPPLNGSWATYYRLAVPRVLDVERFLYVDADTLCDVDVSELQSLDVKGFPAGWVPEAPLALAVDRQVAEQLGKKEGEYYFNAGVMLFNVTEWRKQKITEKAMDYIAANRPAFHDQSAFNFVLYRNAFRLDEKFNCITNSRKSWPALNQPRGSIGRLIHFWIIPNRGTALRNLCIHNIGSGVRFLSIPPCEISVRGIGRQPEGSPGLAKPGTDIKKRPKTGCYLPAIQAAG